MSKLQLCHLPIFNLPTEDINFILTHLSKKYVILINFNDTLGSVTQAAINNSIIDIFEEFNPDTVTFKDPETQFFHRVPLKDIQSVVVLPINKIISGGNA